MTIKWEEKGKKKEEEEETERYGATLERVIEGIAAGLDMIAESS